MDLLDFITTIVVGLSLSVSIWYLVVLGSVYADPSYRRIAACQALLAVSRRPDDDFRLLSEHEAIKLRDWLHHLAELARADADGAENTASTDVLAWLLAGRDVNRVADVRSELDLRSNALNQYQLELFVTALVDAERVPLVRARRIMQKTLAYWQYRLCWAGIRGHYIEVWAAAYRGFEKASAVGGLITVVTIGAAKILLRDQLDFAGAFVACVGVVGAAGAALTGPLINLGRAVASARRAHDATRTHAAPAVAWTLTWLIGSAATVLAVWYVLPVDALPRADTEWANEMAARLGYAAAGAVFALIGAATIRSMTRALRRRPSSGRHVEPDLARAWRQRVSAAPAGGGLVASPLGAPLSARLLALAGDVILLPPVLLITVLSAAGVVWGEVDTNDVGGGLRPFIGVVAFLYALVVPLLVIAALAAATVERRRRHASYRRAGLNVPRYLNPWAVAAACMVGLLLTTWIFEGLAPEAQSTGPSESAHPGWLIASGLVGTGWAVLLVTVAAWGALTWRRRRLDDVRLANEARLISMW